MMNRIIEGDLTQIQIFENNKVALIILTEKNKMGDVYKRVLCM